MANRYFFARIGRSTDDCQVSDTLASLFQPCLTPLRDIVSHTCARIASTGKVVIVMDHRDGSGIATYPRNPATGKECLFYIPETTTS